MCIRDSFRSFRAGVEEAGGVELHEFHVGDGGSRAPGHGYAVPVAESLLVVYRYTRPQPPVASSTRSDRKISTSPEARSSTIATVVVPPQAGHDEGHAGHVAAIFQNTQAQEQHRHLRQEA